MIVVDSSVWIDYFRGTPSQAANELDRLLGNRIVATGDLMITEVLQGFRDDRAFEIALDVLSSVEVIEIGGAVIAVAAARNYRALRKRGVTVRKTIDTLIATRCITDGHELLHNDRDFDAFAGLGLRTVI